MAHLFSYLCSNIIRLEENHSLLIVFCFLLCTFARAVSYLKVRHIIITGNKKTKPFVIHREMTIHENDSFPANEMDATLLQQRLNIFNIGLFNEVNVNIKNWEDDSLDLIIQVRERWVIIPAPIIKFADRNVVEWWKQYNHDFKRLRYVGAQVNGGNLSGRNDVLQMGISFSFAQRLDIGYSIPQFNRRKEQVGLSIFTPCCERRELPLIRWMTDLPLWIWANLCSCKNRKSHRRFLSPSDSQTRIILRQDTDFQPSAILLLQIPIIF
ncbi:MAG: hypothetical protein IPP60_09575 [Sphingobacteriales bacterium]|nr:hypothetical protein [Sphingobacteriales bacterium]